MVEQIAPFSKQSLCFAIRYLGKKILKSHLWRSFLALPEVFSLGERWVFNTPCPPSQIQPTISYRAK